MLKTLRKIFEEGKYVSLYTSSDTEKFIYGRVMAVDDDWIAVYLISPNGDYDGILLRHTDEISRIEIDSQYSKKMDRLCPNEVKNKQLPSWGSGPLNKELLDMAVSNRVIVSLEINYSGHDDVVGFVESVDDATCTIVQVDEYGANDGIVIVKTSDITQMAYDSQDEQRIARLYMADEE